VEDDDEDETLPLCFIRTLTNSLRRRLNDARENAEEITGEQMMTDGNSGKKEDWVNLGKLREDGSTLSIEEKESLSCVMESRPRLYAPLCDHIQQGVHAAWGKTFNRDSSILKNTYCDYGTTMRHSTVCQFSWADNGYSMLASYYPEVADCINNEFLYVDEYTDNCLAGKEVTTTVPVRMAMQIYILRLYGLTRDDYSYGSLNKFLTLVNKVYLKKLACFPERITRQDSARVEEYDEFDTKDMMQYCFIGFQCRRQVELQYVLHALSTYQATRWERDESANS